MTATEPATTPRTHRPGNVGAPDDARLECRVCHGEWPCPTAKRSQERKR